MGWTHNTDAYIYTNNGINAIKLTSRLSNENKMTQYLIIDITHLKDIAMKLNKY